MGKEGPGREVTVDIPATFRTLSSNERLRDILIAALFLLMSCLFFNKVFTSDYGIHLSVGKHIVETGKIPDREFLIYPSLNEPVNFEEMGFQVLLYSVYRLVGSNGVSVFVWLMGTLAFLFVYKSLRARDVDPFIALLTLLLLSVIFRIRLQPRPEIIAYFFTSFLIFACSQFYYKGNRKILFSLPPVFLVWANIHPSTLAGLGVVGAFGTQSLVILFRERKDREALRKALKEYLYLPLGIFALSIVAALLSKHGWDSVVTPVRLLAHTASTQNISEMAGLKNTSMYPYYQYIFAVAVVTGLLGLLAFRIKVHDVLMASYGLKLALQAARGVAFMALFAAPLIASSVDSVLKRIKETLDRPSPEPVPPKKKQGREKEQPAKKKGSKKPEPVPPVASPGSSLTGRRRLVTAAYFVILFSFLGATGYGAYYLHGGLGDVIENGIGLTEHKFSLKSGEFLRNLDIKGNMFNFFDLGGFIEWQVHPKKLTFIDGRGGGTFTDHQTITGAMGDLEKLFDKYNVTYIVTKTIDSSGSILPLINYLNTSPKWELVFADGLAVVFVRNIPDNQRIIDRYGIPKNILAHQIVSELIHSTYLGVNKQYIYSAVGNIYMNGKDYGNALKYFSMAREISDNPRLAEVVRHLESMRGPR